MKLDNEIECKDMTELESKCVCVCMQTIGQHTKDACFFVHSWPGWVKRNVGRTQASDPATNEPHLSPDFQPSVQTSRTVATNECNEQEQQVTG